jgi:uncharacterized membrane protein YobD (UPF0266 family)
VRKEISERSLKGKEGNSNMKMQLMKATMTELVVVTTTTTTTTTTTMMLRRRRMMMMGVMIGKFFVKVVNKVFSCLPLFVAYIILAQSSLIHMNLNESQSNPFLI